MVGVTDDLTERDAQEAAIAAFGGARAIARAHRRPVTAALAEAGMAAPGIPAAVTFGGAAVAIGYAIQMARILLRQRDSGAAGERIPHAG